MNLRVGPYIYRVHQVSGYLHHEGEQCLGLCDNERHAIYVSDVPDHAQQVQIVCHEYMEAWMYHFGQNLLDHPDKEIMCDLFGMAMAQFAFDFIRSSIDGSPGPTIVPPSEEMEPRDEASPAMATKRRPPWRRTRHWHPPTPQCDDAWRVTIYEPTKK